MTPTPNPTPTDDTPASRSRRALLAALASGAATTLAGCADQNARTTPTSESTPSSPDDTPAPSPTATETATATGTSASREPLSELTSWAYPPDFRAPEELYQLERFDLETVRDNEGIIREAVLDYIFEETADVLYLDGVATRESLSTVFIVDGNHILKGSWSKQEAEDAVEAFTNIEEEGSVGKYSIYRDTRERNDTALAVTNGVMVAGHLNDGENVEVQPDSPMAVLERLLAAKRGTKPRFGQVSDEFRTVMPLVVDRGYYTSGKFHETWDSTSYAFGEVEGVTARGQTFSVQDGTVVTEVPYLFESPEAADKSKMEKLIEEFYTYLKNPQLTQESDRIFTVKGTIDNSS